jgi:hypothetical protein
MQPPKPTTKTTNLDKRTDLLRIEAPKPITQTDRPFAIVSKPATKTMENDKRTDLLCMSKPAIKTTERDKETDLLDLDKWTDLFWTP